MKIEGVFGGLLYIGTVVVVGRDCAEDIVTVDGVPRILFSAKLLF